MLRGLRPLDSGRPWGRLRSWGRLFGRKGNRRTRVSSGRAQTIAPSDGVQATRSSARILACSALAVAVAGGAVGLRALLLHGSRFALTEVRVSSLKRLDPQLLVARSGLSLGSSLFTLDLKEAERRVSREPWVASVRVHRELPHTVAIDVVEREVGVAVALGAIYLVDEAGAVFKRARAEEAADLPVVTGMQRDRYLADPARSRAVLRRAIALTRTWREHGKLAPLGELHHEGGHDAAAAFTVYFPHAGRPVAVRLGAPDQTTADRLARLDAVMAALDRRGAQAALVHLDQRTQLDRIAVRVVGEQANFDKQNAAPARAGDVANQAL